ncbi:ATP-binding protein [Actinophytocola sp.]|uniref:ATP-binding protein n=1 Tax=Actinophytocola sp. TaxID=1872138 RepID=UPI002ED3F8FA
MADPIPQPRRTASDLVVSAADLLAGRVSPDEAIVLLDGLLTAGHESPVRPEPEPDDRLLRHAPSVVLQLWPDRWVTRTAALSQGLGYPPGAPREPLTLVHPADRGKAMRAYVETASGRSARRTVTLRVRATDGEPRIFEATFAGLPGPSVAVYAHDLTGWHADRARLRELVPRLNHGVMVVDEAGYVRLTNTTLTKVFGPRAGCWTGQHEAEVLRWLVTSCRDVPKAGQRVAALAAARQHHALRLLLADGRTVHVDRTPVRDAGLAHGALWRFWDVPTPGSTREEPRVLAAVSEELSSIARLAEALSNPAERHSRKAWRSATEEIARDTRRVLTVVDDLLLLSRLDSGEISLRYGEVEVPELVRAAVADRTGEAEAAGVMLACRTGGGPAVVGDGNWLRQAVDNLVRNAVKFSAEGSTVVVSARHEGPRWAIVVGGRGIGIPAADLERVSRAGGEGNGLGLVICRRLVELHHGELTVERTGGAGVRVTIPVRRP